MRGGDAGTGTAGSVFVCLVLMFFTYAGLTGAALVLKRERVGAAADLAALAAAARAHQGEEEACSIAAETAMANGADLHDCALHVHTVTVTVASPTSLLPLTLRARARAGPAHDPTEEVE
ncbi:Rv3654c family TadE-like protein [Nocardiopsis alkaliphila]|uniref:Rv3654c family TadE-like protein n=1 Tax=Nocardiopsis alkaliphila TaxID=225762 RepID=UPI000349F392|nr:Rv3654c family TadE-like protein [Nocardiopsis alkaliphila]